MSEIKVNYKDNLSDVQRFKDLGIFENNLDEFGNIKLKTNESAANQKYIVFELKNLNYNEAKILDTNSVEFEELSTVQSEQQLDIEEILTQYNVTLAENKNLNEIVNSLIEKYENNDDKNVINAMKNEIINLRIQLGQGNYPSDFQDEYPFLPIA